MLVWPLRKCPFHHLLVSLLLFGFKFRRTTHLRTDNVCLKFARCKLRASHRLHTPDCCITKRNVGLKVQKCLLYISVQISRP